MPLSIVILRDDEQLKIRWGAFHVAAMIIASALDSGQGPWPVNTHEGIFGTAADDKPIGCSPKDTFSLCMYPILAATPLGHDAYTLKGGPYKFVDRADGEEFELRPGDQLIAYRD